MLHEIIGMTSENSLSEDQKWMMRAIELAVLAEGRTSPNPLVGSVVVKEGRLIAQGYHKGPGQWHAEREALLSIDQQAKGATLYVNLEPCCHFGRTPPCTDIILESGISKVVVGMLDPDPRMAGKGISLLQKAGLEVEVGILEAQCQRLNDAYLLARNHNRPRFTVKTACTLDGFTCSSFGESQWITNPSSRRNGHLLRDKHDGILVGVGTVLADDPSLNTRLSDQTSSEDAIPIILDSHFKSPPDAKFWTLGKPPIVFCRHDAVRDVARGQCIAVDHDKEGLNLEQIAKYLVAQGIYSVLLEGGATIHQSFMQKGWVDRLEIFMAPKILGQGKSWLECNPFHLNMAPTFDLLAISAYNSDVWLRYVKQ